MKGNIFEVQHFSVHDGPGIRTSVFLKGCQLRCLWCHNPESIGRRASELAYVRSKCVGCGACIAACPKGAHAMIGGVHEIDRSLCSYCGRCQEVCPGAALSIKGMLVEAQDIIAEVLADKTYYQTSGGGMTLTGGEPLMQREFLKKLTDLGKQSGLHIVLETNGCYDFSFLDGIKENIDLFLIDWKETDTEKHAQYTGAGNELVFETIRRLHDEGHRVLLRCPIIPGYNDREDHFKKIAEMTQAFPHLVGAELLPYHKLGVGKIEKFGLKEDLAFIVSEAPGNDILNLWVQKCVNYGGRMVNR